MESQGYELQALLFRALSHPVRLRILDILARQEACVCHLTAVVGKPQPYVSQQLAVLRDMGLIADRRDGTLIYYRVANEGLAGLLADGRALMAAATGRDVTFPPLPEEVVANCPCPRCLGE